jgi:hypothetical protein
MLFPPVTLQAIADGTVTLAFRRWTEPRVRTGGRQRTAIGVIAFDAIEAVDRDDLSESEANAAGFASRDELLAFVDRRTIGTVYRIRDRFARSPTAWIASIERAAMGRGRDRCCA